MSAKLNSNIRELYSRKGINLNVAEAQREIYADFAGDILFSRDGKTADRLINSVSESKRPKVIEAVLDFIKYLREKINGEKDISFGLIRLETKYKNALKNASEAAGLNGGGSENGSGKSYSIAKDNDGGEVVVIDTDQGLFVGVDKSEYNKIAKKYLNEHFANVTLQLSEYNAAKITKTGIGKYIHSGKSTDTKMFAAKMKAATELENLLKTAEYVGSSEDNKSHGLATSGFDYYKTRFIVDGQMFEGIIDIGISDKKIMFYGMSNIKRVTSDFGRYSNLLLGYKSVTQSDIFDITVSQKEQSVNTNISENGQKDTKSRKYSIEDDTATDYSAEMDKLWNMARSGEIDKQRFDERVNELFKNAAEEYGSIPKGENYISPQSGKGSDYTNPVPKKIDNSSDKVRQFARTIMEGGNLNDEMLSEVKQLILSGQLSYTPSSDNSLINYAKNKIICEKSEIYAVS